MTVFLFPGQGAQSAGMGRELYENFPAAKAMFDRASTHLGRDIAKICFEGSLEELSLTKNLQPALFVMSAVALELLRERGIAAQFSAGFSLGECTALYGCGILGFEDALDLISLRAEYMQAACEQTPGAMYAILGLADDLVEHICANIGGYVVPVNYNCPGQLVIAGEAEAAREAGEELLKAGASKAVKLNVSGAFHSKLMEPAAQKLREYAQKLTFNQASAELYLNVTGEKAEISDPGAFWPDYLYRQACSPVRFSAQLKNILAAGGGQAGEYKFVEIGAGRTLCGFVKRASRDAALYNVEDVKSLDAALKGLLP